MMRALCLALTLVALSACDDGPVTPTPVDKRDDDALFQTDSLAYTLRTEGDTRVTIGVLFTNRFGTTVYIGNCIGATSLQLQKRVGDTWVHAWSPILPACLSTPIAVAAGATRRMDIVVHASTHGAPLTLAARDIPGEYRVQWHAIYSTDPGLNASGGVPLLLAQRISNRFTLALDK